jgi:hypothetical protein
LEANMAYILRLARRLSASGNIRMYPFLSL